MDYSFTMMQKISLIQRSSTDYPLQDRVYAHRTIGFTSMEYRNIMMYQYHVLDKAGTQPAWMQIIIQWCENQRFSGNLDMRAMWWSMGIKSSCGFTMRMEKSFWCAYQTWRDDTKLLHGCTQWRKRYQDEDQNNFPKSICSSTKMKLHFYSHDNETTVETTVQIPLWMAGIAWPLSRQDNRVMYAFLRLGILCESTTLEL